MDPPLELALLDRDPMRLGELLAEQKPYFEPGTGYAYHALTFALYLDQIVRRVDHKWRSLSQYFREEIAEPFGIDINIGLPKPLQYRAARITVDKELDLASFDDIPGFTGNKDFLKLTFQPNIDLQKIVHINHPDIKKLPIGSTHGFGTAQGLAKIYGIIANGGSLGDQRLLSPEIISKSQIPISFGPDKVFLADILIFSIGFQLFGTVENSDKPTFVFGHTGYGGQLGLADTQYKVGMAYTTSFCHSDDGFIQEPERMMPVYDALMSCGNHPSNTSTANVFKGETTDSTHVPLTSPQCRQLNQDISPSDNLMSAFTSAHIRLNIWNDMLPQRCLHVHPSTSNPTET
ncbi:hypothetical protein ScPMuIL_004797 [Solemya velum]